MIAKLVWSRELDRELVRLAKQRLSIDDIGAGLAKIIGEPVTRGQVKSRLYRIRAMGVVLPNLPTGSHSTASPFHRTAKDVEELSSVARDTAPLDVSKTTPSQAQLPVEDAIDKMAERLVALTRKGPVAFEVVCDSLDLSPKKARELIDAAYERGYRVQVDGSHVGTTPQTEALEEQTIAVDQAGKARYFAIVGDIHFGSKHHMGPQFQDFCRIAYKRGVRQFLHVGDLLDGVYSHSIWEQSARGFEEQTALAIRELPQWPDAQWHFIQGNHDETFGERSGLDAGRAIEQAFRAAGRTDLIYHGARGAYLRLKATDERRGLLVHLWHPRDRASAYAKSYRQQKRVEAYPPGAKPDCLASGHWHQSMYLPIRGVHAISAGCWQGSQSSFGKSLAGSPDIGSWIIRYAMTPGGTVRRFAPEWLGYQEVETVREVGLG